jgi:hypothetical protein
MDIKANILQLQQLTDSLLSMAKLEDWDAFFLALHAYEQVTIELPTIPWGNYALEEQNLLRDQLLEIQQLHDMLITLSQCRRAELQEMLQNTVQSRKLSDHYR